MMNVNQKKQSIVIDLEMNPVTNEKNSKLAREVIEIGAVRICDNEIADSFQSYVKPAYSNTVSPYIRRLTGIHDGNLKYAPSFEVAVHSLSEWIGENNETLLYAWSDSDERQIMEEASVKSVELPGNMTSYKDVQRLHYEKMGEEISRKQMALSKAACQYGITMSKKDTHSALYDASITAEILILLNTGRYQKQAAILRRAASDKKEFSGSGFLLGELCKEVFEKMNVQETNETAR